MSRVPFQMNISGLKNLKTSFVVDFSDQNRVPGSTGTQETLDPTERTIYQFWITSNLLFFSSKRRSDQRISRTTELDLAGERFQALQLFSLYSTLMLYEPVATIHQTSLFKYTKKKMKRKDRKPCSNSSDVYSSFSFFQNSFWSGYSTHVFKHGTTSQQ